MPAVSFNKQNDITDVAIYDNTAHIDIWYPGQEDRPIYIHVGLMDVRASDGIRISYDFARDGWRVEQAQPIIKSIKDNFIDTGEHWIEVGFFQSWRFNEWEDGGPSEEQIKAWEIANAKTT